MKKVIVPDANIDKPEVKQIQMIKIDEKLRAKLESIVLKGKRSAVGIIKVWIKGK